MGVLNSFVVVFRYVRIEEYDFVRMRVVLFF